jgi:hypothetical protein
VIFVFGGKRKDTATRNIEVWKLINGYKKLTLPTAAILLQD